MEASRLPSRGFIGEAEPAWSSYADCTILPTPLALDIEGQQTKKPDLRMAASKSPRISGAGVPTWPAERYRYMESASSPEWPPDGIVGATSAARLARRRG